MDKKTFPHVSGYGYIDAIITDHFAVIDYLYVDLEFRRNGIATELMNQFLHVFSNKELQILPSQSWQEAWYQRLGFKWNATGTYMVKYPTN